MKWSHRSEPESREKDLSILSRVSGESQLSALERRLDRESETGCRAGNGRAVTSPSKSDKIKLSTDGEIRPQAIDKSALQTSVASIVQIDPKTKDLRFHLFAQGSLPSQYASDALILNRIADHLPSSPAPLSVDLSSHPSWALIDKG